MQPVILVPGTWGGDNGDWSCDGSAFRRYLEARGFDPIQFRGFSGDVDGMFDPFENGKHADWKAGAWGLSYLLGKLPAPVIAHSHGGNVAAYCAGITGSRLPALVTVCTPVRKDMRSVYEGARSHVGHWLHVYAKGWDLMQRAGELFDGQVGWTRSVAAAHDNIAIPNISHSRLLEDPACFHWWEDAGLIQALRAAQA